MEAWEELAPEYPPGAPAGITALGHLPNPDNAWRAFTRQTKITRKAYAELIAPGMVWSAVNEFLRTSERAEDMEACAVGIEITPNWVIFSVADFNDGEIIEQHEGPDICTAALATIKALGGGE